MNRTLLAAAFILTSSAALATEVKPMPPAGTSTSGAIAASSSAARSASMSRSNATATGGQSRAAATGGRASNAVTVNNGGGGSGSGQDGRAPDVYAPPIATANGCAIGISLGGAGQAGGGAAGFTWESGGCKAREEARIIQSMGQTEAAKERLCRYSMEVRYAYANAGRPCQEDRQRYLKEGWTETSRGWVKP